MERNSGVSQTPEFSETWTGKENSRGGRPLWRPLVWHATNLAEGIWRPYPGCENRPPRAGFLAGSVAGKENSRVKPAPWGGPRVAAKKTVQEGISRQQNEAQKTSQKRRNLRRRAVFGRCTTGPEENWNKVVPRGR